ncbi:MAG: Cof-type HAD-IIB family hydrolase [Coriobacteriaceae bacterium]|nr:Cof-type HAD-IIB family hydrolase [Coriobacteriaceae bacterium]
MIFFSDMDGTFLTSTKAVSDASARALDAAAAAGVEFVPCTGRSAEGIPSEVLAHNTVRHAVSSNGAVVLELDPDEPASIGRARTLASWPLSREKALAVWEIARRFDVTYDIFADGRCYLRRDLFSRLSEYVDDPHILESMTRSRTPVDEEPPETLARVGTLERIAMYWKDPAERDAITAALADMEGIEVTRSYPMNIEVMEAGVSKGAAMTWLCRELGMDAADAVAFGDNFNDIEMLRAAGLGVAMANAEPEVREAADTVCASNDEDGVAAVMMERIAALSA